MPKRETYLWVCTNERAENHPLGSCGRRGSKELLEKLKHEIKERGLKKTVRACSSSCLDVCWAGPAMAVMPKGDFYGRLGPDDAESILNHVMHATSSNLAPAESDPLQPFRLTGKDFDPPPKT